jgi:transcriptional regulator with XRE-family HTH domain
MTSPTLGERIQKLRKECGLTQMELAKHISISHTQMVRYENKNVQPPADVLQKLSYTLKTSIDFLINGDKDQHAIDSIKDNELLRQFRALETLSTEKQSVIKELIDAFLFKSNIQQQLISA